VIRVAFTTADGRRVEAEGDAGDNLLRLAQAQGLPLEGTCEGQMACSTSPDWFTRLPAASEDEEDMLDLAVGACRTSRLSCQIELTADLDGMAVQVPAEARDMRRF
jgi:ferredoxin